jgi:XRE family transcriptional regulator, regulator of sulfur utilization
MGWCLRDSRPANVLPVEGRMNQPRLFGKRVKAARRAAKLTQEELAETAHLNPKYLGQIERGEKSPSFEMILELAKSLYISPALLFDFEREETDDKVLRKRIDVLLQKCSPQQLQLIHRVAKTISEP